MASDRSVLDAFLEEAGFARLDHGGGELVLLEPSASETMEVRRSEKSVVVTISTRARDRHGDVIDPGGVRLDRFRKNPVVLYAHDYKGLPVAKSLWEKVRPSSKSLGGNGGESIADQLTELIAKPQFHLQTELSREVWALVEKGVLAAWSIGFIPEEWEPGETTSGLRSRSGCFGGAGKDEGGRRKEEGVLSLHPSGFRVLKWDLLEYSCVPVPANFEALTHELKERRITAPALVKSLAPLGLKAPDLVAHDVTDVTEDTESTESERHDEPREAAKPSPSETSVSSVASAVCVEGATADGVAAVVGRAFERVLRRARGEGYVGD